MFCLKDSVWVVKGLEGVTTLLALALILVISSIVIDPKTTGTKCTSGCGHLCCSLSELICSTRCDSCAHGAVRSSLGDGRKTNGFGIVSTISIGTSICRPVDTSSDAKR